MTALFDTNLDLNRRGARGLQGTKDFNSPGPASLPEAVKAAVTAVHESGLVPLACSGNGRALLALLTFSYARQIYASSDVAARLWSDPSVRDLCGDALPDVWTLRRFRGENREALASCLRAALRFLAGRKLAQGFVTRVCEAHLAEEARRRITMAMFLDSLELDKDRATDEPPEPGYLLAA
jgi:Transposase domain (DUF772)